MTQSEYKLLLEVLAIETFSKEEDQMIDFLLAFFDKNGIQSWRDDMGNVYAQKGELTGIQKYPLVVAHTDTVHRIHRNQIFPKRLLLPNFAGELKPALQGYDQDGNLVGLGADCKVGVALCLIHFLRQPLLKGFFPVQEEIGARGAEKYDAEFMQNVGYAIEFDSPANTSSIILGGKLMNNLEDPNGLGKFGLIYFWNLRTNMLLNILWKIIVIRILSNCVLCIPVAMYPWDITGIIPSRSIW